jgi:glutamate/tyrosine decarboxylase-like PLP-dependent enzyme
MLAEMFDYLEQRRRRPVWQPLPDAVRARFREPVPHQPTALAAVHATFRRCILPFATGNTHPGFFGWVHGGGTAVGMLAEMLAAGLNANLGGRDHAPIEVERQVVRWVRELFGFPATATGLFVTGTSLANFLGVLIARTAALGPRVRAEGLGGGPRLTAYTSTAAHGCIAQALEMAGLGRAALRCVPVGPDHRIPVAALAPAIAADRRAGYTPFLLVGTAGTVDVGAIDDLAALAALAARERLWFHVDGAYGALAILAPAQAPALAGIQHADSLAFDFHKWGQVPYDAGFLLVRDGTLHQQTFAAPAAYLRRESRGLAAGAPWPCDLGPDLSRGFRALKTWFTLKVYGTDRLGAAIARTCALAQALRQRIAQTPELELCAPVPLNIVCFRYRAAADRVNAEIVMDLQEAGRVAPSATTLGGRVAIRAAIVNHRTDERDLDALVAATLAAGRARTRHGA